MTSADQKFKSIASRVLQDSDLHNSESIRDLSDILRVLSAPPACELNLCDFLLDLLQQSPELEDAFTAKDFASLTRSTNSWISEPADTEHASPEDLRWRAMMNEPVKYFLSADTKLYGLANGVVLRTDLSRKFVG